MTTQQVVSKDTDTAVVQDVRNGQEVDAVHALSDVRNASQASDTQNTKFAGQKRWVSFPVALFLFFAVNFAVACCVTKQYRVLDESVIQNSDSEARQQGRWAWWLSRSFLMRHKAPDIAVFGSSQIGAATFSADAFNLKKELDCVTHRNLSTLEQMLEKRTGQHLDTVNLGMGGAMVSDAYMITKALFHGELQPSMAIITVSPRDFIDNDLVAPSATDPFKFLAPYVKLDGLEEAAYPETFSRFDWFLNQNIALKRLQHDIQSHLTKTITDELPAANNSDKLSVAGTKSQDKKLFLQAILGSVGEVKPGEWVIPSVTPPGLWMDNTKEYLHRYKNPHPPIFNNEKMFFNALLADLHEKHIPVLIVQMPSMPMNRALLPPWFWGEYRMMLLQACKQYDDEFCDLSDNPAFLKEHYLDTVHLNSAGGNMAFNAIADAVVKSPRFSAIIHAKSGANRKVSE
jgi:hypothetical protein